MSDEPSTDVDFVRFLGARVVDADTDERNCKVVDGTENLNLRHDASLLAISNRYGALFVGAASGFRWAWLSELREACASGGLSTEAAAATLHSVDVEMGGGLPFALALSADDATLALVSDAADGGDCGVSLFDVTAVLGGNAGAPPRQTLAAARAMNWRWHPTDATRALALDSAGALQVATIASSGSAIQLSSVVTDQTHCTAEWNVEGSSVVCGTADGRLVRYTPTQSGSSPPCEPLAASVPNESDAARVCMLRPLNERFVLLGCGDDGADPSFCVVDRAPSADSATIQDCGEACMPLGREPPDGADEPPRRVHAVGIPDWRMTVVCTSDSDEVFSLGARDGKKMRWQRWILPDEEGPPAVPPFESADGDIFEDQFVMGLGLDLVNTERLVLIAGEEKFPPSPVVWAVTSHGSLLAWTALHKKAPAKEGKYAFMRTAEARPSTRGLPAAAPPTEATPLAATTTLPEAKSFEPSPASAPAASPFSFGTVAAAPAASAPAQSAFGFPAAAAPAPSAFAFGGTVAAAPASSAPAPSAFAFAGPSAAPAASAPAMSAFGFPAAGASAPSPALSFGAAAAAPALAASGKAPAAATPFSTAPAASGMAPAAATPFSAAPAAVASAKPNPKASEDLQNAAEMGDHEALKKALAEGADVNAPDAKQLAPLHWAAKCGRPNDVQALIDSGAKIDITNKGLVTPLIYAASEGWDDCVPLLLKAGADRTHKTGKGRTALDAAKEKLTKVAADERPRFEKVIMQLEKTNAERTAAPGLSIAPAPAPAGAPSAAPFSFGSASSAGKPPATNLFGGLAGGPAPAAAAGGAAAAKTPAATSNPSTAGLFNSAATGSSAVAAPAPPSTPQLSLFTAKTDDAKPALPMGAQLFGSKTAAAPAPTVPAATGADANSFGFAASAASTKGPPSNTSATSKAGVVSSSAGMFAPPTGAPATAPSFSFPGATLPSSGKSASKQTAEKPTAGSAGLGKASANQGSGAAPPVTTRALKSPLAQQLRKDLQQYGGSSAAQAADPILDLLEELEQRATWCDATLKRTTPSKSSTLASCDAKTARCEASLRALRSRALLLHEAMQQIERLHSAVLEPAVGLLRAKDPDPEVVRHICMMPLLPEEMHKLEIQITELEGALKLAEVSEHGTGREQALHATLRDHAELLHQHQSTVSALSRRAVDLLGVVAQHGGNRQSSAAAVQAGWRAPLRTSISQPGSVAFASKAKLATLRSVLKERDIPPPAPPVPPVEPDDEPAPSASTRASSSSRTAIASVPKASGPVPSVKFAPTTPSVPGATAPSVPAPAANAGSVSLNFGVAPAKGASLFGAVPASTAPAAAKGNAAAPAAAPGGLFSGIAKPATSAAAPAFSFGGAGSAATPAPAAAATAATAAPPPKMPLVAPDKTPTAALAADTKVAAAPLAAPQAADKAGGGGLFSSTSAATTAPKSAPPSAAEPAPLAFGVGPTAGAFGGLAGAAPPQAAAAPAATSPLKAAPVLASASAKATPPGGALPASAGSPFAPPGVAHAAPPGSGGAQTDQTELHKAAKAGNAQQCQQLIGARADVNAVTKAGVTPLIYAASEGWPDAVSALLQAGADRTMVTKKGRTALQAATEKMAKADPTGVERFKQVMGLLDGSQPSQGAAKGVESNGADAAAGLFGSGFGGLGGLGGTNPAKPPAQPFGAPQTPAPARAAASSSGAFGTASPSATGGGASPFATPSQPTSAFGGSQNAFAAPSAAPSAAASVFGGGAPVASTPSAFGASSATAFGSTPFGAPGGVGFAGAASTSAGGAFGAPPATPAFGQSSGLGGGGSVFGGAAAATPAFGKPSAMGMGGAAAPAFGQPSGLGAGSPATPAFGQPSTMGSGTPAFSTPAATGFGASAQRGGNAFGAIAAGGAQPAFGGAAAASGGFGAVAASGSGGFGAVAASGSGGFGALAGGAPAFTPAAAPAFSMGRFRG